MVTLVAEDGTGLPTANSFLTVEEADAILELNIHSGWPNVATEDKPKLLIWATRLLSERARWYGKRVSETSALPFPRSGIKNQDGIYYPDDEVPQPVKIATAMLAEHLILGDPTVADGQKNVKRLDVDVISLQFDVHQSVEKWPSAIAVTLRDLARLSFSRTGGKPIIKH